MNRRFLPSSSVSLHSAVMLVSLLAASCAGDEFTGSGTGGAGSTSSTDAASASSSSSGAPSSVSSANGSGGDTGTSGGGGSPVSTSTGGGGSSGEGGSGGSSGSGGNSPVDECDPELAGDLPIVAACGIFVDPGLPEAMVGGGTQDNPYRDLNHALATVSAEFERRIYVREGQIDAAVTVAVEGVTIYGGMSVDWTHPSSARTTIALPGDVDAVAALTVGPAVQQITIADFDVIDAVREEGSSVAALVTHADLALVRVSLSSSAAPTGIAGTTPSTGIGNLTQADGDLRGTFGSSNDGAEGGPGGPGRANVRPGCTSVGGRGGDGGTDTDGSEEGEPGEVGEPGSTPGGVGETQTSSCDDGEQGDDGSDGPYGNNATGLGTFTEDGRYAPSIATPGSRGQVGRAGGGGGGEAAVLTVGGDGGCGGSAGGCGGFGGTPGRSGAASFALVALESSVTFGQDVSLSADVGGRGGDGGPPQAGAFGGPRVSNVNSGCAGGAGGRGGQGGWGGAGAGGHSIAIADVDSTFIGRPLMLTSDGGDAGTPGPRGEPGQPGYSADIVEFPYAE